MTCKYLKQKFVLMPPETGGLTPDGTMQTDCQLNRIADNDEYGTGYITKCEATPYNGPCWVWQKHHPDESDPKFPQD